GEGIADDVLEALSFGCLTPHHAGQLKAFLKQARSQFALHRILKGETGWPSDPKDRDVLYFLAQSLRAQLVKELPSDAQAVASHHRQLAHRAKALIKELASISLEMAQLVVADESKNGGSGGTLPSWLMVEIVRDL